MPIEGMLTQTAEIWGEGAATEFNPGRPAAVFTGVPCALDTLLAGSRAPIATPGAPARSIVGVVFVSDPRLGMLPNRLFNEGNWFLIDGKIYDIAEIHEARNRISGELDHFEIYVYEGVNR